MYRHIGKRIYTIGRPKWTHMKWGAVVGVGNPITISLGMIVVEKTWIKKVKLFFGIKKSLAMRNLL